MGTDNLSGITDISNRRQIAFWPPSSVCLSYAALLRGNRAVAAPLCDAFLLKPKRSASSVARHGVARFRG